MNTKEYEEAKRDRVLTPQQRWALIQAAILSAQFSMKPDQRKPQIQMAMRANSPLGIEYRLAFERHCKGE